MLGEKLAKGAQNIAANIKSALTPAPTVGTTTTSMATSDIGGTDISTTTHGVRDIEARNVLPTATTTTTTATKDVVKDIPTTATTRDVRNVVPPPTTTTTTTGNRVNEGDITKITKKEETIERKPPSNL